MPAPKAGFYTTDAFVDNAIAFIHDEPTGKPFFLYVAFNAPHYPLMAPQADIEKFRDRYTAGWDVLREQRYRKQIDLGIIDKTAALSPLPKAIKPWASLNADERRHFEQIMPWRQTAPNSTTWQRSNPDRSKLSPKNGTRGRQEPMSCRIRG